METLKSALHFCLEQKANMFAEPAGHKGFDVFTTQSAKFSEPISLVK